MNLPPKVDNIKRNLVQTQTQLDTVNETLPFVIEELEQLPEIQRRRNETSEGLHYHY